MDNSDYEIALRQGEMSADQCAAYLRKNKFSNDSLNKVGLNFMQKILVKLEASKEQNNEVLVAHIDTVQDQWRALCLKTNGLLNKNGLFDIFCNTIMKDSPQFKIFLMQKTRHKYIKNTMI